MPALYDRYNIVGTSGSGKTTFARALAQRLGLECIELDRLHWKSNWNYATHEELDEALRVALKADRWVLDGNYKRTIPIKWERELCVVWLDYSFATVLRRAIGRALNRAWTKQELWPGTNNRESFAKLLFSRDSIVLWTLQTFHSNRRKYTALQRDVRYSHVHFIHLKSPKEAERWLLQQNS